MVAAAVMTTRSTSRLCLRSSKSSQLPGQRFSRCRRLIRKTNFFALGGHSLLAIQCLSKLREKLPIVLDFADFFENATSI